MNKSYIQESTLITSIWHENIHEYLSPNIVQNANASGNEKKICQFINKTSIKGFLKTFDDKKQRRKTAFRPYFGHNRMTGKIKTLNLYM